MTFTDVLMGKYYHDAVKWAAENKIIEGYDTLTFGPDDPITREQEWEKAIGFPPALANALKHLGDDERAQNGPHSFSIFRAGGLENLSVKSVFTVKVFPYFFS